MLFVPALIERTGEVRDVALIQTLVDNNCGNSEIGANSNTPLGGALYNAYQYFSGTYRDPFTNSILATPIGPAHCLKAHQRATNCKRPVMTDTVRPIR